MNKPDNQIQLSITEMQNLLTSIQDFTIKSKEEGIPQ